MALTKITNDGVDFSGTTDINIDSGTFVVDASTNRVGVGTASPSSLLEVQGADTAIGSNGTILVKADSAGADDGGQITLGSGNGRHVAVAGRSEGSSGTAGYLQLGVRGSSGDIVERLRIDSSGRLLVGVSASSGADATIQSFGTHPLQLHRGANVTGGPNLTLSKSRNTAYGSNTIVQDDDTLGTIQFRGDDGTDYTTPGAYIQAFVDGTPGENDMPGRLVFSTTADGAASPTERMRIDSSGRVGIGTTPSSIFHIKEGTNKNLRFDGGITEIGSVTGFFALNDAGSALVPFGMRAEDLRFATGSSERVRIDSSGNVGIGTTNPSFRLEVESSANDIARFVGPNSGNIVFRNATSNEVILHTGTSDALIFGTNGNNERFRIGSSGQLGIAGANYGTSGQVLTSQGSGSAPQWATPSSETYNGVNLSGTGHTWTGIPTGTNNIIIAFAGWSFNSSVAPNFRIGTSSGLDTSGSYNFTEGATGNMQEWTNQTSWWTNNMNNASWSFSGIMHLRRANDNNWVVNIKSYVAGSNDEMSIAGNKGLSGALERVSIFPASGNIDSGNASIVYY